jgi:hypothetical protein
MNFQFIQRNKVAIAVCIFLAVMAVAHLVVRPALLYNKDGSFREFGLGHTNKTVVPIWAFSIAVAIFSYLAVLYYIAYIG